MATKQILGDDPFAEGAETKPAPEKPVLEKPAPEKKKAAKTKAAPGATTTTTAAATTTPAAEAPRAAPAPKVAPAPRAAEREPSEYGPSIDQPPAAKHSGLAEDIHRLEDSMRARLTLTDGVDGEHAGERRRLPLEFLWKRWRQIAMRDRSEYVDEFGRDPHVAQRFEPLLDFFYKSYFRVETRGLGHIPDSGRALIVANHSGTLPYDGAMIMHAVKREHPAHRDVRPLVENFVFHFPYLGTLMNRIGGVRACPENAERLLAADQLVAVFPEGVKGIGKLFADRYQLQRFGRGGFIKLALKCDAPIIPTAVVGAEEIHPMLAKITWLARSFGIPYIPITPTFPALGPLGLMPLPSKWLIAFGEPLYYNTEYGVDGANDRILVNRLADEVRTRIQDMVRVLLDARTSTFM